MFTPVPLDMRTCVVQRTKPYRLSRFFSEHRPFIDSVAGTVAANQILTLSGVGFGLGAANHRMETFSGGVDGADITTLNTNFDVVSATNTPTFITDSRSGSLAADVYKADSDYRNGRMDDNIAAFSEAFVSFARKTPVGKTLPHAAAQDGLQNASGFYAGSDDKYCWWDNSPTRNDLVTPTRAGQGEHAIEGNTLTNEFYNSGTGEVTPEWWNPAFQNNWYRYTTWIKADPAAPETNPGKVYFNVCNAQDTLFEHSEESLAIFLGGVAPYSWTEFWFPGWMRERTLAEGGDNIQVIYDDIYRAWGDRAAARVEIGDAATYGACTDLAICDFSSWTDTEIQITLPDISSFYGKPLWVYIIREDNIEKHQVQLS